MELNQKILEAVYSWGRTLPGFTPTHAREGLLLVQMYVDGVRDAAGTPIDGIGFKDDHSVFLLAMHIAWMFWIDERFDQKSDDGVSYDALLGAFADHPTSPEGAAFCETRTSLFAVPRSAETFRLWEDTARAALHACQQRDHFSRGQHSWSYAEYLYHSEQTCFASHFLATVSLVYDLDMPARLTGSHFCAMLHHLGLTLRLQNDLASVDKERAAGERANAVLLLERFMTTAQARTLVAAELRGYTHLLRQELDQVGLQDPFARLACILVEATAQFYSAQSRYNAATS